MFERYTEKARRVIFFARYEASQLGGHSIDADHIMLGLLREARPILERLLSNSTIDSFRGEIESKTSRPDKLSASVDLPLSPDAKRVLSFAADESDRLGHHHIGTEHLLLGLIKEGKSVAAQLLNRHGLSAEVVAAQIDADPATASAPRPATWQGPPSLYIARQLNALTKILIERGVITPEEFADEFNWRLGHMSLESLLDLLVSKDLISKAEKQEIIGLGE